MMTLVAGAYGWYYFSSVIMVWTQAVFCFPTNMLSEREILPAVVADRHSLSWQC